MFLPSLSEQIAQGEIVSEVEVVGGSTQLWQLYVPKSRKDKDSQMKMGDVAMRINSCGLAVKRLWVQFLLEFTRERKSSSQSIKRIAPEKLHRHLSQLSKFLLFKRIDWKWNKDINYHRHNKITILNTYRCRNLAKQMRCKTLLWKVGIWGDVCSFPHFLQCLLIEMATCPCLGFFFPPTRCEARIHHTAFD